MSSHNNSLSSYDSSEITSTFEIMGMPYSQFDVVVTDINENVYQNIGMEKGIEHLSPGAFSDSAFPIKGTIYGHQLRFMIPLVVQRYNKPDSKAVNVWFLIYTGSPFTCITVKTMEAIVGAGNVVGTAVERKKCDACKQESSKNERVMSMAIQDQHSRIECQISKGHFEEVNILGADAMRKLKLSIDVDWEHDSFKLIQK